MDADKRLDEAGDQADEILFKATHRPELIANLSSQSSNTKWRSIHQKLLDLYIEESKAEPKCKHLRRGSHLLTKLVKRDNLNTVILSLYPGNEGYSLMLRGRAGIDTETVKLPYEETELLEYVDEEQLPPLLVDLLDRTQASLFYSGCVIMEVRDYRRSHDKSYDSHHVLLRPTPQSLLCDVNAMANDGRFLWTREDLQRLESDLILHTSEPLCLDPDPSVFLITNKLQHSRRPLNTHSLRRSVKKYSQSCVNRKRKMAQYAAPAELALHEFLSRKQARSNPPSVNLKVGKSDPVVPVNTCVDMWRQKEVINAEPEDIMVEQYAKVLEKPKVTRDNTPVTVEEYTFETERSHGKVNYSRLTILQRLSDEFYLGELYVDRDYVENLSQGSTCNRFPLGTKSNVEKYIRQFREIFTEEGRRQVKITHQIPGQLPMVTYTQTVPTATTATATATSNQALLAQSTTITGQLSVAGGDGMRKTPIRLSLSLNPGQSGTLLSPQAQPVQSPVGGQLTLLSPQQQVAGGHRIRQLNVFSNLHRSGSELSSPGTTSVSAGLKETPTPTQTPPPITMPTTPGSRRQSITEYSQQVTIIQDSSSSTPSTPTDGVSYLGSSGTPAAVNIGSMAARQPTINISSLQGLGAVQGLPQNIQVSVCSGGSQSLAGGITLPISMLPGNSTEAGVAVGSTSGKTSSYQTYVTMVSTGTGNTSSTTPVISSAPFSVPVSVPASVMSSPSPGLMSLPIGVHGNLTQFMAGIKGHQGLQPLLLSRLQGQQPVQLLNTAGLAAASHTPAAQQAVKHSLSSPPPQPHSSTTVVASGSINQPAVPQLQTGSQPLTHHQLLQLTSHPQLQTHLTIQKPQLHSQPQMAKTKSKKRNSTPPKS